MSTSRDGIRASVVVAVLTYQRTAQVGALLPLLLEQGQHLLKSELDVEDVRIVVVDNDPAASASDVVAAHAGAVEYHHEARRGISHARNRALDEAQPADLLVFIDDDETPDDGWLAHLVRTRRDTGAQAVAGRVVSEPDGDPHPFVVAGGFLERAHRLDITTGAPLARAATNNLLLDLQFVRHTGLRFDPRFGLTGGEDSLFTSQLVGAGGRLVWCAEAVVLDHVTVERMTPDYMLRRARAMSSSGVHVDLALLTTRPERAALRIRVAARELLRAAQGTALLLRSLLRGSLRDRARGRRALARSRGAWSALWGRRSQHYAPSTEAPVTASSPTRVRESTRE